MYIKGVDSRIFKDFKESYLLQLLNEFPGKSIVNKISSDIIDIRNKLNISLLSNLNINYWLVRGWDETESKIKIKFIKETRKRPKFTSFQKEFWLNKGYTLDESIKKISEIQRKNCESFNKKRKHDPLRYKNSSPMKIEFWIERG